MMMMVGKGSAAAGCEASSWTYWIPRPPRHRAPQWEASRVEWTACWSESVHSNDRRLKETGDLNEPDALAFVPRRSCSWIFNDPTGDTGLLGGMFQRGEKEAWRKKGGRKKQACGDERGWNIYLNCKGLFTLLLLSSSTGWRNKKRLFLWPSFCRRRIMPLLTDGWKPSGKTCRNNYTEFFSYKVPRHDWLRWSRPHFLLIPTSGWYQRQRDAFALRSVTKSNLLHTTLSLNPQLFFLIFKIFLIKPVRLCCSFATIQWICFSGLYWLDILYSDWVKKTNK